MNLRYQAVIEGILLEQEKKVMIPLEHVAPGVFLLPGHLELSLVVCAVSQIEIDYCHPQMYAEVDLSSKMLPYDIWVLHGTFKDTAENGSISLAEGLCSSEGLRREPQSDRLLATFFSVCSRDSSELGQLLHGKFGTIFIRGNRS